MSQHHYVTTVDIVQDKVDLINDKKISFRKKLALTATVNYEKAYSDADFVIIAVSTNYDSRKNFFDTSAVEDIIKLVIKCNISATIVIKSTIPVGYTNKYKSFWCRRI